METVLFDKNKIIREFTGIENFHRAGYYGERTTAATGEDWDISKYNPDGLVELGIGYPYGLGHPMQTAGAFFQVAPKAHLIMIKRKNFNNLITDGFDIIKKKNVVAMWTSVVQLFNIAQQEQYEEKMKEVPYFNPCWAIGNNGEGEYNSAAEINGVIAVGAFNNYVGFEKNEKIDTTGYSGSSKDSYVVDFLGPSTVYVPNENQRPVISDTKGQSKSGTSFATPWISGMICLIDDFFIDKTGKPLTREKMYQFLIDHCIDVEIEGMDKRSGYGIPCLPNPEDIDIAKYTDAPIISNTPSNENEVETKEDIIEVNNSNTNNHELEEYQDKNKISSWAIDAVKFCTKEGFLKGDSNNKFRPKDYMTREEIAVLVERIVKKLNK